MITDKTDKSQTDTLTFELDLQHKPEKVWRAITDPELVSEWLLPASGMKLEPGIAFTLKTQPYPGWDGTVHCKMMTVEPNRKLQYSWMVGDMTLDTIVTFLLTPTAEGTKLLLTQSGFKPTQKQNFGGAIYGWRMMAGKLIDVLARRAS
ncbi:MAG: SRPBCC domain-containing protein [Archangium sp.]